MLLLSSSKCYLTHIDVQLAAEHFQISKLVLILVASEPWGKGIWLVASQSKVSVVDRREGAVAKVLLELHHEPGVELGNSPPVARHVRREKPGEFLCRHHLDADRALQLERLWEHVRHVADVERLRAADLKLLLSAHVARERHRRRARRVLARHVRDAAWTGKRQQSAARDRVPVPLEERLDPEVVAEQCVRYSELLGGHLQHSFRVVQVGHLVHLLFVHCRSLHTCEHDMLYSCLNSCIDRILVMPFSFLQETSIANMSKIWFEFFRYWYPYLHEWVCAD